MGCRRAQLTQAEKERNEDLQRMSKRHRFADDLREQIVRHEKEKVEERAAFFDEGVRLDQQAQQRRLRLDEIKTQKLNELRYVSRRLSIRVPIDVRRRLF
jgi:hypothetical protein